jgi:hypothetical protein
VYYDLARTIENSMKERSKTIQIKPEDRWKAAFSTPFGLYQPMVMFFGLCNSPAINLLNEFTNNFDIVILQEPPWFKIGADNGREISGSIQLQGWTPIMPTTSAIDPTRPCTFAYVKK